MSDKLNELTQELDSTIDMLLEAATQDILVKKAMVKICRVINKLDEIRMELPVYPEEVESATPNTPYWWCPECGCEVDATRVTCDERHDVCGHPVEWREGDDER